MNLVILALPCIFIISLMFLRSTQAQQWLRGVLEKRWKQPARIVNTMAAAGALSGLVSFGLWPLALIIFPLPTVAAVKLAARWGWLDSRVTYAQTEIKGMRRPLRLLYVAAAALLLVFWLAQLWMVVISPVTFPIVMAYGHLRTAMGFPASAAAEENFMFLVAYSIAILLYCGLVNCAFRRLTRMRSRALAWQFVGWISLLMLCSSLLNSALGTKNRPESEMFLPLLLTAILTAYLLKQAGSVLGQWLARSNAQLPMC